MPGIDEAPVFETLSSEESAPLFETLSGDEAQALEEAVALRETLRQNRIEDRITSAQIQTHCRGCGAPMSVHIVTTTWAECPECVANLINDVRAEIPKVPVEAFSADLENPVALGLPIATDDEAEEPPEPSAAQGFKYPTKLFDPARSGKRQLCDESCGGELGVTSVQETVAGRVSYSRCSRCERRWRILKR